MITVPKVTASIVLKPSYNKDKPIRQILHIDIHEITSSSFQEGSDVMTLCFPDMLGSVSLQNLTFSISRSTWNYINHGKQTSFLKLLYHRKSEFPMLRITIVDLVESPCLSRIIDVHHQGTIITGKYSISKMQMQKQETKLHANALRKGKKRLNAFSAKQAPCVTKSVLYKVTNPYPLQGGRVNPK